MKGVCAANCVVYMCVSALSLSSPLLSRTVLVLS